MGKTDELLNESFNYAIASNSNFEWVEEFRYGSSVTQVRNQSLLSGIDNKTRGVMVIVAGIGHGDTSSNPGRD